MRMRLRVRLDAIARAFGSVRVRLTLWYLAIIALVFLVFSGVVYGTALHDAQMAETSSLLANAQQLAATYSATDNRLHVDYPLSPGVGPSEKRRLAGTVPPLKAEDIVLLLDPQSQVDQTFGPLTPSAIAQLQSLVLKGKSLGRNFDVGITETTLPISQPGGGAVEMDYGVYITQIMSAGRPVATLVLGQPREINQTLRALVPGLLVAGPLTLLVAAVGGYWLATRAMRPVRLITRAATEIGATDLGRRLNLKRRDELGELAATFDRMLDRLEAAFARQRRFTADASHELRTPLTIVGLEVSRGLAQQRTPEEYEQILSTIQLENEYMGRLVHDLLTLARADAGQAPLRRETVDLGDVALEAVERLTPLAHQKGITLATGALPESRVWGDRVYLAHMLANLVANGIKYTSAVGTRVQVESGAGTGARDGWGWVRVADDGPGIAAEHLPHLFDRFYQVDRARSRDQQPLAEASAAAGGSGGSGLGLAIAQWVAHAHGGEITVRSDASAGAGAVFEVWLPLAQPPAG